MKPDAVQRAIGGAPARTFIARMGQDSAMVYVYPSKQAYVYFVKATKPPYPWELTGWRIGATEAEGEQPMPVSATPYEIVANDYYQKGLAALARGDKSAATTLFDKAIPLLMTLQQIDPTDDFASQAIPDIYTRLERTDKAKQEYERILAEHPSRLMYVNYGTLLMKAQDFQNSVNAFEKALALKPDDESALFDIAAAYKNWAAADQKAGKKTEYKTELDKSTDYFERLRAINKTDPAMLENLAENYDILGKKDKSISLISEFEALKGTDVANSPDYWEWLAKLYARANRSADSEAAYKKADAIKQAHK
jgi:tetratricopeptide (TPR) repeat protein